MKLVNIHSNENKINFCLVSENISKQWINEDPYVKFTGEYHGVRRFSPKIGEEFVAIPGYCAKLSDMINNWRDGNGMKVPYDGPLYAVDVKEDELWTLPSWIDTIVGYSGPPEQKIPTDIIKNIWNLKNVDDVVRELSKHGFKWPNRNGFVHDIIRSVIPGVKSNGQSGYDSEIIVNVPRKLQLISIPSSTDDDGYSFFECQKCS
jgi:hypothetical protein